jgi:hypothetical protein
MRKFGLLRAMAMSFYSADVYRDVGRNWHGAGLLYLLVLLAICWVPTAVRTHLRLHRYAIDDVPKLTAALPDISIKNGVMSSRPPGRHEFREDDPRPGEPAGRFVIDDTIDEVPSDLPRGTMILTRREFGAAPTNRAERRIFALSAVGDIDLTRERVRGFLRSLQFWVPPVAYVGLVLGSLAFRFVQICLYGVLAQTFARGKQVALDFSAALRISAVAVTPVIVLRTLMWFVSGDIYWYLRWPIVIIITVLYLRFAIAALAVEPAPAPLEA